LRWQGYGFVNFMKMEDAQQAILALNGYQLLPNKALQVSFKTQKTVGAGGSGGGGGGGYGAPPSY
jgi:non-ribosomal peptide synthetase component E (peptide arylation enzyme)